MRFLGVDLAWRDGNPSGVALLGGQRFPLHLRETPRTLASHAEVLDWITRQAAHHRVVVGIDAPLLGLRPGGGRRGCDDEISRRFGRFHAATHSPPREPGLRRFASRLVRRFGREALGPCWRPRSGRPAIREVYPNALQVRLFGLDGTPGGTIVKYKRRRFRTGRQWARAGLGPFVERCVRALGGRYVATPDPAWARLVAERPEPGMSATRLKSIEDRWDALLCALAVALEFFERGSMRYYPGTPGAWRRGFILAPALGSGRALNP
jgi:predicted RNase H-like nuclease